MIFDICNKRFFVQFFIRQTVTATNNAMVINKIRKFVELLFVKRAFVEIHFIGTVFVVSIISSHIITESAIALSTCLTFLQLNVAGFEMKYNNFCTHHVLPDFCTHTNNYCCSTFDWSYVFYHQTYIYTCMMYVFLMFLISLFL